jgi:hypothetical protein
MNREMAAIGEGKCGDLLDAKNEMLKRMCDNSEGDLLYAKNLRVGFGTSTPGGEAG